MGVSWNAGKANVAPQEHDGLHEFQAVETWFFPLCSFATRLQQHVRATLFFFAGSCPLQP